MDPIPLFREHPLAYEVATPPISLGMVSTTRLFTAPHTWLANTYGQASQLFCALGRESYNNGVEIRWSGHRGTTSFDLFPLTVVSFMRVPGPGGASNKKNTLITHVPKPLVAHADAHIRHNIGKTTLD